MFSTIYRKRIAIAATALLIGTAAAIVGATHSWGGYHWARTANPFTLKLGDNVSSAWDAYLSTTSSDWSVSSVLDTVVVTGLTNPRSCKPINGRVEVCSAKYGFNGWLGLAQIWVSGNHIAQAVTKLNDTYFNTGTYNTPGWRNFVMCQEVGHAFGLDHQDEVFSNVNLGTCMDYTDDPTGALKNQLSNEHPNKHDYDMLETIYAHLDSLTTVGQPTVSSGFGRGNVDLPGSVEFGRVRRHDDRGRPSLYELDLGKGEKVFTFVLWAN